MIRKSLLIQNIKQRLTSFQLILKNILFLQKKKVVDLTDLSAEISNAEEMKKHLNEYARMKAYQGEVEQP